MEAPQSAAAPVPARMPSLLEPDPGAAAAQAIGLLAALEGGAPLGAGATGSRRPRRAAAAAALLAGAAVLAGVAWHALYGPGAPDTAAMPASDGAGADRCAPLGCLVEQETNLHSRALCKPCRPAPP
ncbi:hypothetical protein [Azohydromonas aeria]|uniref:hypothetical protein n=1 Tax=Azohydromonas aeria TaxID=2590212 RepID=UPI0012F86C1B|nr:hypothetical protein [Azohydromonas aeria]